MLPVSVTNLNRVTTQNLTVLGGTHCPIVLDPQSNLGLGPLTDGSSKVLELGWSTLLHAHVLLLLLGGL